MLEPWLERRGDLSAQLFIGPDAELLLLGTAELVVERSGLYRGHRGWVDDKGRVTSGSRYDETLREAAVAVARAAGDAGYRGPCGVDAFCFEREPGRVELRSVVEFNARFTLGVIAIGLLRRALPRIPPGLAPRPGERCAFYFGLAAPPRGWPRDNTEECLVLPLARPAGRAAPALLIARDRAVLDARLGPLHGASPIR